MKALLQEAIYLIEQIEEHRKRRDENEATARKTDIPEYRRVCFEIAKLEDDMIVNISQQLKLIKQQILSIWHD